MKAFTNLALVFLGLCVVFAPYLTRTFPLMFSPLLPSHALMISAVVFVLMMTGVIPLVWAFRFDRAETHRASNGADNATWGCPPVADSRGTAVVLIHGTFASKNVDEDSCTVALGPCSRRDSGLLQLVGSE